MPGIASGRAGPGVVEVASVLVFVAIRAQQLPVAAVGRVVVVVVIPVMDFEQLDILASELARAAAANPGIHSQRQLAIALRALLARAPRLSGDPVQPRVVRLFSHKWHA